MVEKVTTKNNQKGEEEGIVGEGKRGENEGDGGRRYKAVQRCKGREWSGSGYRGRGGGRGYSYVEERKSLYGEY